MANMVVLEASLEICVLDKHDSMVISGKWVNRMGNLTNIVIRPICNTLAPFKVDISRALWISEHI